MANNGPIVSTPIEISGGQPNKHFNLQQQTTKADRLVKNYIRLRMSECNRSSSTSNTDPCFHKPKIKYIWNQKPDGTYLQQQQKKLLDCAQTSPVSFLSARTSTAVKRLKRFSFCLVGFYLMLTGNIGKDV